MGKIQSMFELRFFAPTWRTNNDYELLYTIQIYNLTLTDIEDKCMSINSNALKDLGLTSPIYDDIILDRTQEKQTPYPKFTVHHIGYPLLTNW